MGPGRVADSTKRSIGHVQVSVCDVGEDLYVDTLVFVLCRCAPALRRTGEMI